jgi:hypothetical protein
MDVSNVGAASGYQYEPKVSRQRRRSIRSTA